MTKKQWIADGLLLAAAIIWGSAFAVVKNTLDSVPPSLMIALRFGIAALISGVILRKHLRGPETCAPERLTASTIFAAAASTTACS